jgi:serine/threonine-protein kinase
VGLFPGTRVGPYEIANAIGAGGMGEVYRARDTRLKRDVALKILPESFAADPERLARFQREAEVLASVNHPNIAAIHGLEDSNGPNAIVMELVEGPTLADRIAQGPLAVDEALPIARQIAEALQAAHEQGIIHRDLKPANVKVRPDGTVKVLDFGLAKGLEPRLARGDPSASPTITSPAIMTGVGVMLGSAAYMSPEQARGKPVDERSDIWAFGCVLYEMLTGRRAFPGDEVSDVVASVLAREPDWTALPDRLPFVVGVFLRRCLHKDRSQRIGDAQSLRLALEGAFDRTPAPPQAAASQPWWHRAIPVAAALVLGGLVAGVLAWSGRPAEQSRSVTRFVHPVPPDQTFRSTGRIVLAVSRDGRQFVYNTEGGLYLRSMDALDAQLIPGTETRPEHVDLQVPANPFFAPDGRSVAYFEGGQLKRIDVGGGAAFVICSAEPSFGASWEADNTVLFGQSTGILRVSADGGMPQLVVRAKEGEFLYGPQLLPGGDAVLFTATTAIGGNRWDAAQVVVQSIPSGERTVLLHGSDARYVTTGHLLYAVDDALFAVPFDPARRALLGGSMAIASRIVRAGDQARQTPAANYAISDNGSLVYLTGGTFQGQSPFGTLVWVDRQGREEALGAPRRRYSAPRLSPDGTRVAFEARDPQSDMWIWEIGRRLLTSVTSDAASDILPVWSPPDGERLVWASTRGGGLSNLYTRPADGTGGIERVTDSPTSQRPSSFTPDGTRLMVADADPTRGGQRGLAVLGMLPIDGDRRVAPWGEPPILGTNAEISPDGRWVAYEAREGGRAEVYVRSFGGLSARRWQVSTNGGREPLWARSGRELFYLAHDGTLMGVPIEAGTDGTSFVPRTPVPVISAGGYYTETAFHGGRSYDVSGDGARFLRIKTEERGPQDNDPRQFVVVQNWSQELERRALTK